MTEIILTSSVLILLLAVLRQALRGRIDPRAQYALWLLAARLLIPGTLFTAPVSVAGAAEKLQESILLEEMVRLPADGPSAPSKTELPDGPSVPFVTTRKDGPTLAFELKPPGTVQTEKLLDLAWKVGMGITGGSMVLSNLVFWRRLRKNRKPLSLSASCWAGGLPVYEADGLPSPCLFGLFRPAVYLNEAAVNAERPEHILAHEYAHYRHRDHLWSILRSICLVIHWYNPLVWWAAALSRRDCELACDAAALQRLGEPERIGYGQTLLGMVSRQISPVSLFRTATTMTSGKRAMTERIALIAKQPRTRKITLALVAAAACLLAACSFGGNTAEMEMPDPSSSLFLEEFPGLHWNDTPEAVMETLGITEEEIIESSDGQERTAGTLSFVIGDYPLYGNTAQYVIFRFEQWSGTGSDLGLYQVQVCYPDDMEDFGAVQEALLQQLGPETESSYQVSQVNSRWKDLLGDRYDRWVEIQTTRGIKYMKWNAGPDSEAMEALQAMEENYQSYWTMSTSLASFASLTSSPTKSLMPAFEEFTKEFTGVKVAWNCNTMFSPTFNTVIFDGSEYVYCLQVYSVASGTRNARLVVNAAQADEDPVMWIPYMNYLNWDALRQAAVDAGLDDGSGFALEVMEILSQYIEQNTYDTVELDTFAILTATEGLDDTLKGTYSALVRQLHDAYPSLFARAVLWVLPEENQNIVLDYFCEGSYNREEVLAQLKDEI
ncbi:MAG: M56 family metallopeptidase [Oscillospiraceae bacterium]|nr:M56 family metallopeptidase [Oscillospiraceae bacterium]